MINKRLLPVEAPVCRLRVPLPAGPPRRPAATSCRARTRTRRWRRSLCWGRRRRCCCRGRSRGSRTTRRRRWRSTPRSRCAWCCWARRSTSAESWSPAGSPTRSRCRRVQQHVLLVHGGSVLRRHLRVHGPDVALQELAQRAAAVLVGFDRRVCLPARQHPGVTSSTPAW
jgi:hypothetical protein